MAIYDITSFRGGLSDYEDKGIPGSFKFAKNIDVRKELDSLSSGQALVEEGLDTNNSPSASVSPSASTSPSSSPSTTASPSASTSPSSSLSRSPSATTGISDSPSLSPSVSVSASPSTTASSSISPSPSPSGGLTTVFDDLILFFVKASDGYTYGFGNTGSIYRRDADGLWLRVYKDTLGKIKGAEEKPSDTGKLWLYWATDTTLKRKEIPGLSNWNDIETVSTNLSSCDWHTMKMIGGGLKIANKSNIALVGYDDSYTNEALNLIPGNIAKTIVERDGRAIIGTYREADPDKGINAAIDAEMPLAQVGNDGNLYFADMANTMPIKRIPGGGKVNPGGVTNEVEQVNFFTWEETALSWIDKQSVGNLSLWGVYGGDSGKAGIYSYGRKNKNHPTVLNMEYELDVDEIGAIATVDGITLASYRDGTSFGVRAVDPTIKAVGTYEGLDFKAPIKKPVNVTVWKYAEVFMAPLPENCRVAFYYRVNKNGDFIQAGLENGATQYNTTGGKKAVFLIGTEGEIFEPKIVMTPSGNTTPEIYRIRVYFE